MLSINLYDYVVEQLAKYKGEWPTIAADTGIAYGTLVKIARKDVDNPGVVTIQTLAAYLEKKAAAA